MFSREILLSKIKGYLNNALSKEAVYAWVLSVAVAKDYEQAVQNDALMQDAVRCLMNITQRDPARIPSTELLEYFCRCLAGDEAYDVNRSKKYFAQFSSGIKSTAGTSPKHKVFSTRKKSGFLEGRLASWLRFYILGFAVCSLMIQLFSVLDPNFMRYGEGQLDRAVVFKRALFQIVYATFLLFPISLLAREPWIFFALPTFIFGAFYYWKLTLNMALELKMTTVYILAIIPFSILPATLALLLLFLHWKKFKRKQEEELVAISS